MSRVPFVGSPATPAHAGTSGLAGTAAHTADAVAHLPLLVEVDEALLRNGLLCEAAVHLVACAPERAPVLAAILRGRRALADRLAAHDHLDVDALPLRPSIVEAIAQARRDGCPVALRSWGVTSHVQALARRLDATDVIDSRAGETPPLLADGYDHVVAPDAGAAPWPGERLRYVVGGDRRAGAPKGAAATRTVALEDALPGSRVRPWLRALRPHQWSKNALLVLPALAAHLPWTPSLLLRVAAGVLAFCMAASAVYLYNDLFDLPHDRRHRTKRARPLAAGDIGIAAAAAAGAALGAGALALAALLSPAYLMALVGYLSLTIAYSVLLKRHSVIDVIALATLYTLRLVAGAALVDVLLSRWFVSFSVFFFLSLALVKRVVELQRAGPSSVGAVAGRAYLPGDATLLSAFGGAAAVVSALVYCLYISAPEIVALYRHPAFLWAGLPLLLYWQGRVWLFASRGAMRDDPVVFALRDRVSLAGFATFLAIVFAAAR